MCVHADTGLPYQGKLHGSSYWSTPWMMYAEAEAAGCGIVSLTLF